MSESSWFIHSGPRITELTFANALSEGPRFSKASVEAGSIWKLLIDNGVDPSFALGHFWTESLFGTAGWNVWSDPPLRSWGNILYVNSQLKDRPGVGEYKASNGYEYTYYPDWTTGVEDYCLLLADYRDHSPDSRYGDTSRIHGATAKWMGKVPESDEHLRYLDVVLARIDRYDNRPDFEGDMFTWTPGINFTTNLRYEIKPGEHWFVRAGGVESYPVPSGGKAFFLGQVHGSASWAAIRINTARFSPDKVSRPVIAYVKDFDPKRVTKA